MACLAPAHRTGPNKCCLSKDLIGVLQSKITPFLAVDKPFSREMNEEPYILSLLPKHTLIWSEGNKNNTIKNNFKNTHFSISNYIFLPRYILLYWCKTSPVYARRKYSSLKWISAWPKWINRNIASHLFNLTQGLLY